MKQYKVIRPVVLGFEIEGEKADLILDPSVHLLLEVDKTIRLNVNGHFLESTTPPSVIDLCLELGSIEPYE